MLWTRAKEDPAPPAQPAAAADTAELAERQLVRRVAARELWAFEALYRSYHRRLARFLDRMTRHPDLVDELVNDTMLVVWNRADSYNGQSKVSTWIFAIAYRKALKALHRMDEPVDDEAAEPQASGEPGPEQQLGLQQLHEALQQALAGLSAPHRAVIDLTYFHGADCREIAEIVGCPVDTVKTRMFHARRRLRGLLAGRLEDWL
jgi:RNA polymerase sigma-70 factor (ECF subfamily)